MALSSQHVATSALPRLRRVMPRAMFTREILVTLARPRALLIKLAVPLVLTVPLLAGHAPTFWAGMLLSVLCAITGAIGAAVTTARARESGLLTRLALTPRPAWRVVASWVAGGALVDAVQLAPAIVVVLALSPVSTVDGAVLVL
ncbi:MAG: hypothetical protein JOZ46_08520, partial [Candidatus Dormibacteraeota bacterium]|nr:hypothetical protein [Candidatus Dormibacteraeota bacterium]